MDESENCLLYLLGRDGSDVAVLVADGDPDVVLVRGGAESVALDDQGVPVVDLEGVGEVDVVGVLDVLQAVVPPGVGVVQVQQAGHVVHPQTHPELHRRRLAVT